MKLYRGVSLAMHEDGKGLSPKGTVAKLAMKWGEFTWGDGTVWGESPSNAAIKHQAKQESFPESAFVSTSPHFHIAERYALHASDRGMVYEIDTALLAPNGIQVFPILEIVNLGFADPDEMGPPEDDEHALLATPSGPLPEVIIVRTIPVKRPRT